MEKGQARKILSELLASHRLAASLKSNCASTDVFHLSRSTMMADNSPENAPTMMFFTMMFMMNVL